MAPAGFQNGSGFKSSNPRSVKLMEAMETMTHIRSYKKCSYSKTKNTCKLTLQLVYSCFVFNQKKPSSPSSFHPPGLLGEFNSLTPWICSPYRLVTRSKGGDNSAFTVVGATMDAPSPRQAARRLRNVKLGDATKAKNASNRSPGRREVLAMIWRWIFCWKEILAKEVGLKKTHTHKHSFVFCCCEHL